MELSNCNIKRFLLFSQNKTAFMFQETETLKKNVFLKESFSYILETEISYISGEEDPKKRPMF